MTGLMKLGRIMLGAFAAILALTLFVGALVDPVEPAIESRAVPADAGNDTTSTVPVETTSTVPVETTTVRAPAAQPIDESDVGDFDDAVEAGRALAAELIRTDDDPISETCWPFTGKFDEIELVRQAVETESLWGTFVKVAVDHAGYTEAGAEAGGASIVAAGFVDGMLDGCADRP